jgi:hypothetical protein
MSEGKIMTEREELAARIETNPPGWLPGVGDVVAVTFTTDEAAIVIAALRTPSVTDEMVEAAAKALEAQESSIFVGGRPLVIPIKVTSEAVRTILTAALALALPSSPAPMEQFGWRWMYLKDTTWTVGAGATIRAAAIEECALAARAAFDSSIQDYALIGPGGLAASMIGAIRALITRSMPGSIMSEAVMPDSGAGDPDIFDTRTNAGLADLIERSHLISVLHKSNGIDRAFGDEIKARIVVALRRGESVIGN